MTKRKKKFSKADVQGLNGKLPGIRSADRGPAQLRGGKQSFAKRITRRTDADEERSA